MSDNILDNLCVIHADFDIWSGQTRLSVDDFTLGEGGKIPPERLAQLGSKRICNPGKLRGFSRLKTQARRLLLRAGMPFMDGFAVPVSKADELVAELGSISKQFETMKEEFIAGYHQAVDEWCQENAEYEAAIRAGTPPRDVVEKRIAFEFQVFMIQPVGGGDSAQRLDRKVERLGGDLIDEVVRTAGKFFSDNLAGRTECATSTAQTLRNLRDKVDGLAFLNGDLDRLVELLDSTLQGYAQFADGRNITAPFIHQVTAAVLILSDKKRIEQYIDGAISVDDMTVAATPVTTTPVAVPAPAADEEEEDCFF